MLMDKYEKHTLLGQALRLTALGETMERERAHLRELVQNGLPYCSPEMTGALERFDRAEAEWKRLEREHLALKASLQAQKQVKP